MTQSSIDIVRATAPANTPEAWAGIAFEPAFFDPGSALLPSFPTAAWRKRYAEHLGFHVSLRTHDLQAHVRRILLWAACGHRKHTYRALNDLFQVLGPKGVDLRRDIFRRVTPILSSPQVYSLQSQFLATEEVEPVVELPTSRFAPGMDGKLVTSEVRQTAPPPRRGPLEEALECLENGQVEEAQRILEAALLEDPDNAEVQRELLEIYRRARDLAACRNMYEQLGARPAAMERDWEEAIGLLANDYDDLPDVLA